MNHIEQILANSIYESNQFSQDQIDILNEMYDAKIDPEQIGIVAHPDVSELSYSILADYLKENTITSNEYAKYLNVDPQRINDVIINVYLGKMHGLSEEQIALYIQKEVYNIKIARILVERSKDIPAETLEKLVCGKFGSDSLIGKLAIQDYINGDLSIDNLMLLESVSKISEDNYHYIKNIADKKEYAIVKYCFDNDPLYAKDFTLQGSKQIKQSMKITETTFIDSCFPDDIFINCDTYDTYRTLYKYYSNNIQKAIAYYNYTFTANNALIKFIKLNKDFTGYSRSSSYDSDNLIRAWFDHRTNYSDDSEISKLVEFAKLFDTLDDLLMVFINNTRYFNLYNISREFNKQDAPFLKDGCSQALCKLLALYTTKKDIETEIPYLKENLKDFTESNIGNIAGLKKAGCSNADIHYAIENYKDNIIGNYLRTHYMSNYFYSFCSYKKFVTYYEYFDGSCRPLYCYLSLKKQGATSGQLDFFTNNKDHLDFSYINCEPNLKFLELLQQAGIPDGNEINICIDDSIYEEYVKNYKYAMHNFKDKPKCIGLYLTNLDVCTNINKKLILYIEKFDDDNFYSILNGNCDEERKKIFIEFCLKMCDISTNYTTLYRLFDNAYDNSKNKVKAFVEVEEKVTKDVIVSFCKACKVDSSVSASIIPVSSEEFVQDKIITSFNNSKNFKAIQYDSDNVFVDIIGNKKLLGTHVIKFSKDDSEYKYIFEIKHEDDVLNYEAKIATSTDVKQAIQKSIDLIAGIKEYQEYVEELENLLKNV